MKIFLPFTLFLIGLCACSPAQKPAQTPPAAAPQVSLQVGEGFVSLVDQLDPNGLSYNLVNGPYEVATIAPTFQYLMMLMEVAATAEPNEFFTPSLVSYIKTLPEKMGIHQYTGRGASVIKMADGRYRSKYVYQTTPQADGLLWHLDGEDVDVRAHLQSLPESTVGMTHFALNLQDLYKEIKSGIPSAQLNANATQLENSMAMLGLPLNSLLTSLNQGWTIGLSFNEAYEWVIPVDKIQIRTPEIAAFMILSDADQVLYAFLLQTLKTHSPLPVLESTLDGHPTHMIPLPIPVSTAVSLQIAHADGKLYLATNPPLLETLLQKRSQGADIPLMNLLADAEVTQASVMWLTDPKKSQLMQKIMQETMTALEEKEDAMGMSAMAPFYRQQLESLPEVLLSGRQGDFSTTLILHRSPMGNAMSSSTLMTLPMVTGLAAAIALPSFQRAREQAKNNACINNLRLIESAKDQWAIEENKPTGAEVTAEDIQEYIRNGIPVCPDGGTYTLGTVGNNAECSVHGSLKW